MSKIIAHRGASYERAENTMSAFRRALELGADGIELDIHMTKDGRLCVIHDADTMRTTGVAGAVGGMTMDELKQLNANFIMDGGAGPTESIPELCEVLELMDGTGKHLNIEIKTDSALYPGIEQLVLSEVEKYDLPDLIFSSFNHYTLRALKAINYKVQTGLLYMSALVDPWIYAKHAGARAIHPYYYSLFIPKVAEDCLRSGIQINAWTVDNPDHIALMRHLKVTSIITNRPDLAL